MPPLKHIHLYGRKPIYTQHTVWACHIPECSHYQPVGTKDAILEGKMSVCWNCGRTFKLDARSLQNDKPCCSEKCQLEYDRTESLTRIPEPEVESENSAMCTKCKIRLKHGDLNWCWQCTMS